MWRGATRRNAAFVEKLFHALVKQPVLAYGPQTLPDLQRSFAGHEYNIRKLMVEIMAVSALTRYNSSNSSPAAVRYSQRRGGKRAFKGNSHEPSTHPPPVSPQSGNKRGRRCHS